MLYSISENLTSWGENIAMGQVSCDEVTEDWKETNDPYDGQGHRRNMLDPGFNRVGIAAYKIGGTIYWVQDFDADTTRNLLKMRCFIWKTTATVPILQFSFRYIPQVISSSS